MPSRARAVCVHGHFYQPPREHPWLGVVEAEPSAAPDHDWNARILRECYAPFGAARLLDAHGRLRGLVDAYAWTSFDVGPTLFAWLADCAPELVARIVAADRASLARTGYGNAWAQAYNHPILPLCTARDVRTQVAWGAREFTHRYGRRPDGMWLPEMAVDVVALEALAAEGITLTLLSPHQARRVRPLGAADDAWRAVDAETLDVRRLYRCRLPSGAAVDVLFRTARTSQGLAFGELVRDGGALAAELRAALRDGGGIVAAATDGETFGHHHRFGEMALAYAIERLREDGEVELSNPAAFRARCPPVDEVEIAEGTSWSCAHGIERWRDDCGCRTGGPPEWSQAWRRGLRAAIDWLRDELADVFGACGGDALRDPWGARERYVDAILEPARRAAVVRAELRCGARETDAVRAARALEMARHALLMQTSCGWFFDDVAGVEATIVLRQAGRAIDLAGALGRRYEDEFQDRLASARSNVPAEGTAADVYRRAVLGRPVNGARIAAAAVLLRALDERPSLPGYDIEVRDADATAVVELVEERTGAREQVSVRVVPAAGAPYCEVDGRRYGVGDLFLVQRAAMLGRVTREAVAAVRAARQDALARLRAVIDPLLAREPSLPLELALMLGYDEAERLVAAIDGGVDALVALAERATTLRVRGVLLPGRAIAPVLSARLERLVRELPARTSEALALLDLAERAGVVLDLTPAQILVARWWIATAPPAVGDLDRLRDRLWLSATLAAPGSDR